MGDPNAQTNAQMQVQLQQAQMAQRQAQAQAQTQVGQMGGMHAPPMVMIPGQPVTTAQMAAQARPPPAEMTLAQIAAQQNAEAAAKKTAKPKKTPKAKAAKKEAVGAGNAPPAAPPAPQPQQHVPQRVSRPQGAPVPLRQQAPADTAPPRTTTLDLPPRAPAENRAAAAARGEEFQPPSFQVRSQHDAAVGIELWLQNHACNFDANELAKKVAMMRHIQEKCRLGQLDPTSARNKIEALACWVELTKTYYICVRESRNLKLRGVQGIQSPTFRLPDTTKQIPPPRPPEDFGSVAELDVAMGAVCGAQTWVVAVEKQTMRG